MTDAPSTLSLDRRTLRLHLDIDLRLLIAAAVFLALLAAELALILLAAPPLDGLSQGYTIT